MDPRWFSLFCHVLRFPTTVLKTTTYNFKKIFYLFLERGEGREEEREKNINVQDVH